VKSTALLLPALLLILTSTPSVCSSSDPEDQWWQSRPEEKALQTNSGELEFIAPPPAKPAHHHNNRITITADSLIDGWIRLEQCHSHLDAVARSEILFHEDRIRNLRITHAEGIGRAQVQGPSIQLWDVGKKARLCLTAESRALNLEGNDYILRNGPYMRRFLDGYYPMHLTLSVVWPRDLIRLDRVSPTPQPGLKVRAGPGRLDLDTWFRGRLTTELGFTEQ
jgi:hypothetical protein